MATTPAAMPATAGVLDGQILHVNGVPIPLFPNQLAFYNDAIAKAQAGPPPAGLQALHGGVWPTGLMLPRPPPAHVPGGLPGGSPAPSTAASPPPPPAWDASAARAGGGSSAPSPAAADAGAPSPASGQMERAARKERRRLAEEQKQRFLAAQAAVVVDAEDADGGASTGDQLEAPVEDEGSVGAARTEGLPGGLKPASLFNEGDFQLGAGTLASSGVETAEAGARAGAGPGPDHRLFAPGAADGLDGSGGATSALAAATGAPPPPGTGNPYRIGAGVSPPATPPPRRGRSSRTPPPRSPGARTKAGPPPLRAAVAQSTPVPGTALATSPAPGGASPGVPKPGDLVPRDLAHARELLEANPPGFPKGLMQSLPWVPQFSDLHPNNVNYLAFRFASLGLGNADALQELSSAAFRDRWDSDAGFEPKHSGGPARRFALAVYQHFQLPFERPSSAAALGRNLRP